MAKAKAAKTTKKPAKQSGDLASVLAQVEAIQKDKSVDYREAYDAIHDALAGASKLVAKLPKANQPAAWQQLYDLVAVYNVDEAFIVASELHDSEPKAPANVRALRLANVAKHENVLRKDNGYRTFQQALALATDDETRGKVQLVWMEVKHDQVTPLAAALEALDLANAGKLSRDLAVAIWERGAHGLVNAFNAKAVKAHAKLFGARNTSREEVVIDSCRRWMAAHNTPVADSCNIVSTLSCTLINTGKIDEGMKIFDEWTPKMMKLHKAGTLEESSLFEGWFRGQANTLEMAGRKKDAAKIRKVVDKLDGY